MRDEFEQRNIETLPRLDSGEVRYARGWFMLGPSTDFPGGEVRRLRYFNRELAAFRGTSGKVAVLDAHCPHMGAHLGINGRVEGDLLRCPYHGTAFNLEGRSVEGPRGDNSACESLTARPWTVREKNGLVLVWHDPEGNPPDFEIEMLEEYGTPGWSDWHFHKMELGVHPREIIENIADRAHFVYVHGFDEVTEFKNEFYRHMATQYMAGKSEHGNNKSVATYFGPAYQITWMFNGTFHSRLLNAHTPVDESHTHLWFGVIVKQEDVPRDQVVLAAENEGPAIDLSSLSLDELLSVYAQSVHQGFEQDVGVWRRKLYRTEPILCDGDGPLAKCRKWYGQFYTDAKKLPALPQPPKTGLNPHIKYSPPG